jgi:hypothetical protein
MASSPIPQDRKDSSQPANRLHSGRKSEDNRSPAPARTSNQIEFNLNLAGPVHLNLALDDFAINVMVLRLKNHNLFLGSVVAIRNGRMVHAHFGIFC